MLKFIGFLLITAVLVLVFVLFILALFNRWLPVWACSRMGWHLAPKAQGFDGASLNGRCPRCNSKVLLDSQGNWFSIERKED